MEKIVRPDTSHMVMALKEIFGTDVISLKPRILKDGVPLYEVQLGNKIQLTIPESCHNSGICEDIQDFPEEVINEIINKMVADKIYFNYDQESTESLDGLRDTVELCDSRRVHLRPKAVRDTDDHWYLVLNSNHTTVQRFKGEQCLGGLNADCSKLANFQKGFKGQCIQKYMKRNMMVLSKDFKKVLIKEFPVPSCCSCAAVRVQ
ncbi:unnamed protein product [Leptosia nina]|uniref:Spaetzle domain-containing protein n=1 Tax=Leptosia nina TaxID=320188 RepID=A0AAV1J920_9NEOP